MSIVSTKCKKCKHSVLSHSSDFYVHILVSMDIHCNECNHDCYDIDTSGIEFKDYFEEIAYRGD